MKYWELDDINRYMAEIKGEKYIELGEEVISEEEKNLWAKGV